jgi:hypothetical protein
MGLQIGKKVVCVDDSIKPGKLGFVGYAYPNWIKEGKVYTVREILPNDDIVPGIVLEEVINPLLYVHILGKEQEPAFRLSRFRELDDQELAIETEEVIGIEELLGV